MEIQNPLHYKGYEDKIRSLQEKTGLKEAVVTGYGEIQGNPSVIAVCDGRFLMASMGEACLLYTSKRSSGTDFRRCGSAKEMVC